MATTTTTTYFTFRKYQKKSLKTKWQDQVLPESKVESISDQLFQFSAYTHARTHTQWRVSNNVNNICIISSK